ncbi:DUF5753 domain-containing protein [Saccharopolyspora elongata]|nr:DUF5753 domain-containing protein [Saccharopolyspora elongata]
MSLHRDPRAELPNAERAFAEARVLPGRPPDPAEADDDENRGNEQKPKHSNHFLVLSKRARQRRVSGEGHPAPAGEASPHRAGGMLGGEAVIGGAEVQARELDQPAWWELHSGLPSQLRALIDAEQRAARITYVSTSYLPGLLQTRSYSRAIFEVGEQTEREVEEAVAVRQSRQGVLDKANPAELLAFLDETVLMRPVGGPAVAADQLRFVLKSMTQPNIEVRVLPLELGAHMGLDGVFSILEFPHANSHVYVEAPNAGAMVSEPEDVDPFHRAVDRLAQVALDEAESAQVIDEHAERMEGEAG